MRVTAACLRRPRLHLPPMPTIGEILKIYQIRAAKQLSQNFLLDQNLCGKFVRTSGPLQDAFVLEVGPGPGCLTRKILENDPKRLVLIEKDRRFIPILKDLKDAFESTTKVTGIPAGRRRREIHDDACADERVKIIRGDILTQRMEGLFPDDAIFPWDMEADPPINVIGNLPFAISTPLLIKWLEDMSLKAGLFSYGRVGFTLTFQKEVAERMVARITNVQRCRLSVMCQLYAHVRKHFILPGRVFVPPPDVDVAVVTLHPKLVNDIPEVEFKMVEKLVRNVFQFRQKEVKGCLDRLFPPDLSVVLARRIFDSTGIPTNTRSYFISNEEIRLLCLAYKEICDEIPLIFGYKHDDPAHLRVPKEQEIYRRFKEIHGDRLWRVEAEINENESSDSEKLNPKDHISETERATM